MNHQPVIGIGMNVQSGIAICMSSSIGMVQIPILGISIDIIQMLTQYRYGYLSGIGMNLQTRIGIGMNPLPVSVSESVWRYQWNSRFCREQTLHQTRSFTQP